MFLCRIPDKKLRTMKIHNVQQLEVLVVEDEEDCPIVGSPAAGSAILNTALNERHSN